MSDVLAYDLRGSGTTAPPPRRSHARTYAYRGLPAFASLSMAGSDGELDGLRPWQQHAVVEGVEIAVLGDPAAALDELLVKGTPN